MAMTGTTGEFSVTQFFPDGTYEKVREFVGPEEAVEAAHHYCHSVGARLGTTVRVIGHLRVPNPLSRRPKCTN